MENTQSIETINRRFETSWQDVFFQAMDDTEYSYADLLHNASNLCASWQSLNSQSLKKGDVVAFKLPNSFALPCCYLACALGGYVACPIVPSLGSETIETNLQDIKPALFIEDVIDDGTGLTFTKTNAPFDVGKTKAIDTTIPFLIMFSSGSTGKNKAICHSLRSVLGSASSFANLSGMNRDTALYHVLPMTYMAGFLNAMLAVFAAGGKIVEGPQFSMETVADFWRRPLATDANTLSVIPPLAAAVCRLTRDPEKIEAVGTQFKQVQCTSQAIQTELRKKFQDKFSLPLQDCYGMTELGGPLSFQTRADAEALNACSMPLPELEIDIREGDELWLKSPFSMLGYLVDNELTSPFDDDGFLDTGDLALVEDGRIEITGRVKDIVIRGGINTSPVKIESVLSQFDGIDEVAVVGLPHEFWGEEIVACIISNESCSSDQFNGLEGEILNYCRAHLDSHEVPDRLVFLDEFPRSFIGKVLKADLMNLIL